MNIAPSLGKEYKKTGAWGDTKDIIAAIMEADAMAPAFTSDFALSLPDGSIDDHCRYLWHWVRKNIQYREDPDGRQDITLPGALYTRGYGDCKSMTLFTASVIKNLYGDIYCYRFISQDANTDLHHVYLVVKDENGNDIIIDCVEDSYGVEIPHQKQKDMYPSAKKIQGPAVTPQLMTNPSAQTTTGSYQGIPTANTTTISTNPSATTTPTSYVDPGTIVSPPVAPAPTSSLMSNPLVWLAGGLALYLILKD
jgi:hypothetical protein